jgi:uncharacterized pyridoxamine 5'-phosphate oxidase family protein
MKKKFKFGFIIIAFFSGITFIVCSSSQVKENIPIIENELMIYKGNNGLYGYCDAYNYEIIIPAQYEKAYPFVGYYAVVGNDSLCKIINKNNISLINDKFEYAKLYLSENKKTIVTRTRKHLGHDSNLLDFLFHPLDFLVNGSPNTSRGYEYKFYNLTDRISLFEESWSSGPSFRPNIRSIGNYMFVSGNLYICSENGKLEYFTDENIPQIMNEILIDRGIIGYYFYQANNSNISVRGRSSIYNRMLNETVLKNILPEGWEPFDVFYSDYYLYYGENYTHEFSFKMDDLYSVRLKNEGNIKLRRLAYENEKLEKKPYDEVYFYPTEAYGIYNDSTGEWYIEPFLFDGSYFLTEAPNCTTDKNIWFLNLRSIDGKNKLKQLYNRETKELYPIDKFGFIDNKIIYMGHSK